MAQAKFDIRTEVTRPLFAYVGVTDRAVEAVRESVTDLQKRFVEVQTRVISVSKSVQDLDFEPKTLRAQATTVVNGRVEALSNLLKQTELTYGQLVVRGETLVERIRRQQSTQDAVSSAKTSSAKAKTTRTQAAKATRSTTKTAQRAAKSTAKTAERAAKTTTAAAQKSSTAPQSSAKATATTAKRAARSAGKATAQGAKKVGD